MGPVMNLYRIRKAADRAKVFAGILEAALLYVEGCQADDRAFQSVKSFVLNELEHMNDIGVITTIPKVDVVYGRSIGTCDIFCSKEEYLEMILGKDWI